METKVQTKLSEAPIKIAVVVTYLIMIAVNAMANILPINGIDTGGGIGFLSEFVCTRRIDVFDLGRHLPFVGWSCALPIRLIPRGQEQGENGTA